MLKESLVCSNDLSLVDLPTLDSLATPGALALLAEVAGWVWAGEAALALVAEDASAPAALAAFSQGPVSVSDCFLSPES